MEISLCKHDWVSHWPFSCNWIHSCGHSQLSSISSPPPSLEVRGGARSSNPCNHSLVFLVSDQPPSWNYPAIPTSNHLINIQKTLNFKNLKSSVPETKTRTKCLFFIRPHHFFPIFYVYGQCGTPPTSNCKDWASDPLPIQSVHQIPTQLQRLAQGEYMTSSDSQWDCRIRDFHAFP